MLWKLLPLSLFISVFSTQSLAGCGDIDLTCKVFSQEEESLIDCNVKVCANANSMSVRWHLENGELITETAAIDEEREVQINKEEGYRIPWSILKDELTCYTTKNLSTIYCAEVPEL